METNLDLCNYAAEKIKRAGFRLVYTSRKSEACYYELPGRTGLIRIAIHGHKRSNSREIVFSSNPVFARITFAHRLNSMHVADDLIAAAVGKFMDCQIPDDQKRKSASLYDYTVGRLEVLGFQLVHVSSNDKIRYYKFSANEGVMRVASCRFGRTEARELPSSLKPVVASITFPQNYGSKTVRWGQIDNRIELTIGKYMIGHMSKALRSRQDFANLDEAGSVILKHHGPVRNLHSASSAAIVPLALKP